MDMKGCPDVPVLSRLPWRQLLGFGSLLLLAMPLFVRAQDSVFQYAVFYDGLLEFSSSATMTVEGRVHANSNIYYGTYSTAWVTFNGDVSATGSITNKPNNGQTYPAPANTTFNAAVNEFVSKVGIAGAVSNLHALIDMPTEGESQTSTLGQFRLFNQSQVVLLVSNTSVTAYLRASPGIGQHPAADPSPIILNTSTNAIALRSLFPFLSITATFYDQRESNVNHTAQIDIGKYRQWLLTNSLVAAKFPPGSGVYPTLLYVADNRTVASDQMTAVRLTNGLVLPENGGQGWTVVTPNPLYVWGNYNCTNQIYLGTTNTSATVPAALISDALTLLSSAWRDSTSSSSVGTSRNASLSNTVNAAILTGDVPSTGTSYTAYSGGVQNLPRLLEDWTGCDLWLNTSIVRLFASTKATGRFQLVGIYYFAPIRHFSFDQNYLDAAKLPPGSPPITPPPVITDQPHDVTAPPGGTVIFTVTVGDDSPLSYQWIHNGTNIAFTQTNHLILNNVQTNMAGTYAVTVRSLPGVFTLSSNAVLTIDPRLYLTIPDHAMEGAGVLTNAGCVSVAGPLTSALSVSLSHSDGTPRLSLPHYVTIGSGQSNVFFDVTILGDSFNDVTNAKVVRASASGYISATNRMTIYDDDPCWFRLSPIPGHLTVGVPFEVSIMAIDPYGGFQSNYNAVARLYISDAGGNTLESTAEYLKDTGNFTNGIWSGLVTINTPTNGVIVAAVDYVTTNWGGSGLIDVTYAAQVGPLAVSLENSSLQFDIAVCWASITAWKRPPT